MTSSSLENSISDKPVPVYVLPGCADKRDEVSLLDLYRIIANHKRFILTFLLESLIAGLGYIFFSHPVYRAETSFLPPCHQDIQEFLVSALVEKGEARELYTPDIIYNQFIQNFKSTGLHREFLGAHNLSEYYAPKLKLEGSQVDKLLENKFNRNLIIQDYKRNSLSVQSDKLVPSFMTASFYFTDPVSTA